MTISIPDPIRFAPHPPPDGEWLNQNGQLYDFEPHSLTLPKRAHPDDAGIDLTAYAYQPKGSGLFMCYLGWAIAPPIGYYTELLPRSSITWSGFSQPNSVGVIDPGYRGPLLVPLKANHKFQSDRAIDDAIRALIGTRIAQLVVRRLYLTNVEQVSLSKLGESSRGTGGFGSTGL